MNVSFVINLVMIGFTLFMVYRIIKLNSRNKLNKKMLSILDTIDDPDTFFAEADKFIETEKDAEFKEKVGVLRLWGDVFYERDDAFKEHLEALNIDTLLNPDGKNKGFSANEDSFFYLFMAVPNRLYYRKRDDLRAMVEEKLSAFEEGTKNGLLKKIFEENKKFYEGTEDRAKPFIESLLEGDYGGYQYSKQLIGLYKHCEEAILAVLHKEAGETEAYEECMADVKNFGTNTRLGKRWLKELGLELPEEPEETEDPEEKEEAEVSEEAAEVTEEIKEKAETVKETEE